MIYKYREDFQQRGDGYRRAVEEAGLEVDSRFLYDIPVSYTHLDVYKRQISYIVYQSVQRE